MDDHLESLQTAALSATRCAATLPVDIDFYATLDSAVAHDIDALHTRLRSLTNRLLQFSSPAHIPLLHDHDSLLLDFQPLVVNVMDNLFERTDACLDQALGRTQPLHHVVQHAAHLTKPQLSFKRRPDNSHAPWHPSLTHKYNAQVPLDASPHPYHYEINHIAYPAHLYTPPTPSQPLPLSQTPFTWVDTPESFHTMLQTLTTVTELAVDLEHHSYRSYLGFLCLMQITTRTHDYIVDLLALRDDIIEQLNHVLTDPNIVKVFHGAESDILWLQQDFNLYVVNLFDSFHASKLLEFPRHGLANLLQMYCDYIPDKRYQLADWRIRPLPQDMLQYARSDTHFLLFIYDQLRLALIDRASTSSHALIDRVLAKSAQTSLRVYTKDPYDAISGSGSNGWDSLAKKWNRPAMTATSLDNVQKSVYKAIHEWRDTVAREEDESTQYVMPNRYLFKLAEAPPPRDVQALLRMVGDDYQQEVSDVVKRRGEELVEVMKRVIKLEQGRFLSGASTERLLSGASTERLLNVAPTERLLNVAPTEQRLASHPPAPDIPSSLFVHENSSLFARKSRLFGDITFNKNKNMDGSAHFQKVLMKMKMSRESGVVPKLVNDAMSVSGENRQTTVSISEKNQNQNQQEEEQDMRLGTQLEIPFVPRSQRRLVSTSNDKTGQQQQDDDVTDTIVVVGRKRTRTRNRKRKRTDTDSAQDQTNKEAGAEAVAVAEAVAEAVEEAVGVGVGGRVGEETFDFTAVSNILDDAHEHEPDVKQLPPLKKHKQKHAKAKAQGAPAFVAPPPRAYRESKGGNQSRTFK